MAVNGTFLKKISLLPRNASLNTTSTSYGDISAGYVSPWYFDNDVYDGTVTVYFEAELKIANAATSAYAQLTDMSNTAVTGSEVSTSSTVIVRVRSGDIKANLSDNTEYKARFKTGNASYMAQFYNYGLVIKQTGSVSKTETIVSLGGGNYQTLSTDYVIIGTTDAPKYYHDDDFWDGETIYYEGYILSGNASATAYSAVFDVAGNQVADSEVSTTSTTPVRSRSAAITLSDNTEYQVKMKTSNASYYAKNYGAHLIILQNTFTKTATYFERNFLDLGAAATTYTKIEGTIVNWDLDEWDCYKNVYLEVYFRASSAGQTVYADIANSGGEISGSEVSLASTTCTRRISSALTLADDTEHYIRAKCSTAAAVRFLKGVFLVVYDFRLLRSYSDAQTITEAVAKETGKGIATSLSISESLANQITLSLSDSISFTELWENTTSIDWTKELSDSLGVSEALAKSLGKPALDSVDFSEGLIKEVEKNTADSIPILESLANQSSLAVSDSQSISEAISKKPTKNQADSVSIVESVANQSTLRLSDSLVISEALARIVTFHLSLSDSETIAENLSKSPARPLADAQGEITEAISLQPEPHMSDSQSIVETLANQSTLGVSDSLSIAEATAKRFYTTKFEAVNLVAVVSKKAMGKRPSDSQSLAEAVVTLLGKGAFISDSISFSESLAKNFTKRKTETVDLFDQRTYSITKAVTDSLSIAEAVGNSATLSLSDSISITEIILAGGQFSIFDTIPISEAITQKQVGKGISDNLSIAEALGINLSIVLSDSISLSEQLANSGSLSISDSILISEGLVKVVAFYRSLTDSVSVVEANAKDIVKVLSDSVTFSDTEIEKQVEHLEDAVTPIVENQAKSIYKALSDTEPIADSEGAVFHLPLADSIGIAEAMVSVWTLGIILADSVGFSEAAVMDVGVAKTESEPISENVANSYSLTLSDAVAIAESEFQTPVKKFTEAVTLAVTLDGKDIVKNLSESLPIADSYGGAFSLPLSDSMGIGEAMTKDIGLSKSDAISFAEALVKVLHVSKTSSLTIAEQFSEAAVFLRAYTEAMPISDSSIAEQTRYLIDSMSIAESMVKRLTINKAEAFTLAEDMETDKHPQRRVGQMAFLRTVGQN